MRKTAFVDIDGVLVDNSERESYAEQAVEMITYKVYPYLKDDPKLREQVEKKIFYHKDTFYREDLIARDKAIANAQPNLMRIWQKGYDIIYLTSRPWSLYGATRDQLERFKFPTGKLMCKHETWRFVRTDDVWKPGMIQAILHLQSTDEAIIIDDRESVRKAVLDKLADNFFFLQVFASIEEAVEAL